MASRLKREPLHRVLALVAITVFFSRAPARDPELSRLFTALDRPVMFAGGIDHWPLEQVLEKLRQRNKLEFVIDAESFARRLNRKEVGKLKVRFDPVSGITTSLFLDMILRQIDAHFETRHGKVVIVPAMKTHSLYHPACLPGLEERRRQLVEAKLRRPVTLEKGLEKMTFGEAKQYFEDRFDLTILVDQGLFPKKAEPVLELPVALPAMFDVPLERVLNMFAKQLGAALEIRGGAVLVIPLQLAK